MTAIAALVLALLVAPCALGVRWFRRFEMRAGAVLAAIRDRLPSPRGAGVRGVVRVHTWHGFLLWVTETAHDVGVGADPAAAEAALDELAAFTRRFGRFAFGFELIPLLSWWQRRRARARVRQLARAAPDPASR